MVQRYEKFSIIVLSASSLYYLCKKPGTKGRWPKGKANRVPRVKVLNYLKKVALFFRFERDILADGAQVIGRDAEKRGEVLQGKVMHDAGTTT